MKSFMGYVWKGLLAGNLDDSCTCQAIAEFFFRRRWKMREFSNSMPKTVETGRSTAHTFQSQIPFMIVMVHGKWMYEEGIYKLGCTLHNLRLQVRNKDAMNPLHTCYICVSCYGDPFYIYIYKIGYIK
jgi:hypothetical protein